MFATAALGHLVWSEFISKVDSDHKPTIGVIYVGHWNQPIHHSADICTLDRLSMPLASLIWKEQKDLLLAVAFATQLSFMMGSGVIPFPFDHGG